MKQVKALVLVSLLSGFGLAQADVCCQENAPVVAAEVAPAVDAAAIEAAKAKKLADDKLAADAAQQNSQEAPVVADKE